MSEASRLVYPGQVKSLVHVCPRAIAEYRVWLMICFVPKIYDSVAWLYPCESSGSLISENVDDRPVVIYSVGLTSSHIIFRMRCVITEDLMIPTGLQIMAILSQSKSDHPFLAHHIDCREGLHWSQDSARQPDQGHC